MPGKQVLFLFLFFFISLHLFGEEPASPASFILEATALHPYNPGFIGNGHFSLSTTRLGIDAAHSYMAGVYDHGEEDIPRIAMLPAWNAIDIHNGNSWLTKGGVNENTIRSYRQQINMLEGSIRTRYVWMDGERATDVDVHAFVSRADPAFAGVKLTIIPRYSGAVQIAFVLQDWPEPKRMPLETMKEIEPNPSGKWPQVWYPGNTVVQNADASLSSSAGMLWMNSYTDGRKTKISQTIEARWPRQLKNDTASKSVSDDSVSILLAFDAEANKVYDFFKYVAVASSFASSDPENVAKQTIASATKRSYLQLLEQSSKQWQELWQTDIEIEGDAELQKVVRSMIFYLLSSVDENTGFSIPPMGLSSEGYYGHIFWDADTWMFPPLLLMHPNLAESIVRFRYRTLDAARHKAKSLGYRGAMFPWESDEIGNETTPQFAYQNAIYEIHITGDVALGQWQYYLATGDKNWLAEVGYPVLEATADFWVSRATYDQQKDRYEIQKVVSVDEGLIGINNDAYTNAVARKNLQLAVSAARVLGKDYNPAWKTVGEKLFIPFDEAGQYHPSYEGAPETTLGSVVPLLSYPLDVAMSEKTRDVNLENAVKRLREEGSGAMMTITLLPLVAAESGNAKLLNELWRNTYRPYLRPPFYVLAETPKNEATNFVTGAGGFLQQVIFGYTGLRLTEDGLIKEFTPMLPSDVKKLTLRNFRIRGKKYNIVVHGDQLTMTPG